MTSAPLIPLKLRLELSKRVSNASFDFMKRLYDRRSIVERYLNKDVNLHVHVTAGDRMACFTFECASDPAKVDIETGIDCGLFQPHCWE